MNLSSRDRKSPMCKFSWRYSDRYHMEFSWSVQTHAVTASPTHAHNVELNITFVPRRGYLGNMDESEGTWHYLPATGPLLHVKYLFLSFVFAVFLFDSLHALLCPVASTLLYKEYYKELILFRVRSLTRELYKLFFLLLRRAIIFERLKGNISDAAWSRVTISNKDEVASIEQ